MAESGQTLKKVEQQLKEFAEYHKKSREALVDQKSTSQQRKMSLDLLEQISIYCFGYFTAIEHVSGKATADYYREYYAQARSKKGLKE